MVGPPQHHVTSSSSSSQDQALKPLLHMLEDCSDISTIRTLILKALSHPAIFCGFDQVHHVVKPRVQQAGDADTLLRTLELFSYGTYREYYHTSHTSDKYLTLSDTQLEKLKVLSVVSLVEQATSAGGCVNDENGLSGDSIGYAAIASELVLTADTVDTLRGVEGVVIAGVYAGILRGKLCQKSKTFRMSVQDGPPCLARDVPVGTAVPTMLETLQRLQERVTGVIDDMNQEQVALSKSYADNDEFWGKVPKSTVPSRFGHRQAVAQASRDDATRSPAVAAWPSSSTSSRHQDVVPDRPTAIGGRRQTKRTREGLGFTSGTGRI